MNIRLDVLNWKMLLKAEKEKNYFKSILAFVKKERVAGKKIYPPQKHIFNAFKYTPYESVKVVILGQDPYHGPGQAHGLSFSVQPNTRVPPSLVNIYEELRQDISFDVPKHGCLEPWTKQGVLLLNICLTVEHGKPQSHAKIGWQRFTDHVIQSLNNSSNRIVFLLWGSQARSKSTLIDAKKHRILKAPHPSPLSAHRGFLGCAHFSKANDWLKKQGHTEIDWSL